MTIRIRDKSPKTYFVAGMHQSGTSMLSKALKAIGIKIVADDKPTFETRDFQVMNSFIISKGKGTWTEPPPAKVVNKIMKEEKPQMKYLVDKYKSKMWGFKDPRNCITGKGWLDLMEDDVYLVCIFRKRDRVIESLKRRDNFTSDRSGKIYDTYNKRLIKLIKDFVK